MIEPSISFTIPSVQDHTELECRIYHPDSAPPGPAEAQRGAIIAHPYANLGGCFDDPAVLAAAAALLAQGFVVGTFNFRGAGGSKGSTSWTGRPEVADYVSFTGFFVHYMNALKGLDPAVRRRSTSSSGSRRSSPSRAGSPTTLTKPRFNSMVLVLGGYSYGARVAMHIPSFQSILLRFANVAHSSAESLILEKAATVAAQRNAELLTSEVSKDAAGGGPSPRKGEHSVRLGGYDDPNRRPHARMNAIRQSIEHVREKRRERKAGDAADHLDQGFDDGLATSQQERCPPHLAKPCIPVDVRFLLISPVLPPIGWLIGFRMQRPSPSSSSTSSEAGAAATAVSATQQVAGHNMMISDEFWHHPTLVVHGSHDQYSSAARVQAWVQELRDKEDGNGKGVREGDEGKVTCEIVPGVGHFWHNHLAEVAMKNTIRRWAIKVSK